MSKRSQSWQPSCFVIVLCLLHGWFLTSCVQVLYCLSDEINKRDVITAQITTVRWVKAPDCRRPWWLVELTPLEKGQVLHKHIVQVPWYSAQHLVHLEIRSG